jgi:hypothetical protein
VTYTVANAGTTFQSTFHRLHRHEVIQPLGDRLLRFSARFLVGMRLDDNAEGAGEYVDDTVTITSVKAAIFNDPSLKSAEINVETFSDGAQMSSFVNSRDDLDKGLGVARDVPGVVSVKNGMRHR